MKSNFVAFKIGLTSDENEKNKQKIKKFNHELKILKNYQKYAKWNEANRSDELHHVICRKDTTKVKQKKKTNKDSGQI